MSATSTSVIRRFSLILHSSDQVAMRPELAREVDGGGSGDGLPKDTEASQSTAGRIAAFARRDVALSEPSWKSPSAKQVGIAADAR